MALRRYLSMQYANTETLDKSKRNNQSCEIAVLHEYTPRNGQVNLQYTRRKYGTCMILMRGVASTSATVI